MSIFLRRREFIAALGGAAAWPLAASAQQGDRVRRIGVLMNLAADDPESQARLTAFRQALQELGWADGRNVLIEYRWSVADVDRARKQAADLIAMCYSGDRKPGGDGIAAGDPHGTNRFRKWH
jgi:putative ABC transport system substrate-binding protein